MKTNGGFLVTKIKQLGDRIFEKILSEKNIDAFNGAQGRILYVLWNASTASERILRSGRSHEYLYQRSDSKHEYCHRLHSGVCILLCPQQCEALAYD